MLNGVSQGVLQTSIQNIPFSARSLQRVKHQIVKNNISSSVIMCHLLSHQYHRPGLICYPQRQFESTHTHITTHHFNKRLSLKKKNLLNEIALEVH